MEISQTEVLIDPEINELVPGFCEARKKDIQNISKLLSENDFGSIAKICHTIKGVSRPYGFPTLENLSRQLETAAKASDGAQSLLLTKQMETYMKKYSP